MCGVTCFTVSMFLVAASLGNMTTRGASTSKTIHTIPPRSNVSSTTHQVSFTTAPNFTGSFPTSQTSDPTNTSFATKTLLDYTTTDMKQTSNATTPHGSTPSTPTISSTPFVNAPTTRGHVNITTALPHGGGKDLPSNTGLIAILCIFFIVIGLMLLVLVVKAVGAHRSNFERLEEVPLGKVNEDSPFAQYSK